MTSSTDPAAPTTAARDAPVGPARAQWMDALRGAAIVLVVCWHSAAVLVLYGTDVPQWLIILNNALAPYRMPILMTLSGMLLRRSLAKPLAVYAWGKIANVLWPLLIWTVVNYAVISYDVPIWSREVWGKSYLWFLYYLVVFYAVGALVRQVPTWLLIVLPWAATVVAPTEDARRFLFLAGFFFLGRLVDERREGIERLLASRWVLVAAAVGIGFSVAFVVWGPWRYQGALAPFSVAGMIALVALAQVPAIASRTDALQWVGRNSIVFYVSHFPVIVGVVLLARLVNAPVTPTVAVGLVAALATGALLTVMRRTRVVSILFALPRIDPARLSALTPRWSSSPGKGASRVVTVGLNAAGLIVLAVVAFRLT